MLVRGATKDEIEGAAKAAGVDLYNLRTSGRGYRFQLHTHGPRPKFGRWTPRPHWHNGDRVPEYKRRRIPGAVCWHGHRDFMRALYRARPETRITTAMADYRDANDFEAKFEGTRGQRTRYCGFELAYEQLCDCED